MADPARLTGGIVPRILASWRRPGRVVRGLSPVPEGALLAILMAAMLVFLIAQAPGHARAAVEDPSIPLGGRMAGAVMAVIFLWPLIAISDESKYTLTLGMNRLKGMFIQDPRLIAAGALVSLIPIIVFFCCFQRYFFRGLEQGGLKG